VHPRIHGRLRTYPTRPIAFRDGRGKRRDSALVSAALRFVSLLATGYFIGFWVIRAGGTAIEAMVISLIVTSLLGFVGQMLEGRDEDNL